jgi:hypothetical protein
MEEFFMYNEIKLEKGLYNLAGKSFTQALTQADPDENYADTPLANLDAFERQLKRFDIKISGSDCDRVEKFFVTTESAVLFPEFVKRAVLQGMEESVLSEVVAVKTTSDCNQYRGYIVSDATSYATKTSEGAALPETTIKESPNSISLLKYGRLITASYEAVRLQRLDVFAVTLRSIGKKLADAITSSAVATIKTGAAETDIASTSLAYSDLINLYGQFVNYNMNTIIASPKNAALILSMTQVQDSITVNEKGHIILPFGTVLIKSAQINDYTILGFDRNYALEMITSSDLVMETDKLIDRQLDTFSVTMNLGFKSIITDSAKALNLDI